MDKDISIILLPIFMSLGFLFGKLGASNISISNFNLIDILNVFTILAVICLGLRGTLWFFIVRKFDLVFAYSIMSLSYVMVLIISNIVFSEPITNGKIIGSLFILLGIYSVSIGEKKKLGWQ